MPRQGAEHNYIGPPGQGDAVQGAAVRQQAFDSEMAVLTENQKLIANYSVTTPSSEIQPKCVSF